MAPSAEPEQAQEHAPDAREQAEPAPASPEAGEGEPTAASPRRDDDTNDEPQQPQDAEKGSAADAVEQTQPPEPPKDAWQAVFSQEANAWYFWNAETGETTWSNPRDAPAASTSSAAASASTAPADPSAPSTSTPADPASAAPSDPNAFPEIDPDLAWLDPAAAARSRPGGGGASVTQTARFNARTGRFQADPALTPDRIGEFQRGQRQQEAYYDVAGWEASLAGKGLKRGAEETDEQGAKRRPSSKQVEKFRQAKEDKKRKKINAWLGS
ncbi:hypothetical protein Rhopal_005889-T1 [Rhodotorula paludigena]|uniref:WW domain-containing protein n=1 Tax=Rhodotorula paludigena TaxID=86838 RepID=A0AAV5GJP1_9BASI|nr:hypothetical protein Rhopal_005889-T1 [Rhodotorula paludigena]